MIQASITEIAQVLLALDAQEWTWHSLSPHTHSDPTHQDRTLTGCV